MIAAAIYAPPTQAATRYTITGWVWANSPEDPIDGSFRQPNAEADFDRQCARGINGTDPRLRLGTRVLVRDGNNKLIGRGRVVDGRWSTPGDRNGRCFYAIVVRNLPKANFYRVSILSERIDEVSSVDAKSNGFIRMYPWPEYHGPNWPE
jgi:hypothetical protein